MVYSLRPSLLRGRLWDMVRTGSLRPPNPIVESSEKLLSGRYDSLPLAKIRPHHWEEAAVQLQARYDRELETLEKRLQDRNASTYLDVVPELDRVLTPLTFLQNLLSLFTSVDRSPEMEKAHHVIRVQFHHHSSPILWNALNTLLLQQQQQQQQQQQAPPKTHTVLKPEHLRAVRFLLGTAKQAGAHLDSREELSQIQSRLDRAQYDFISGADHLSSVKKKLQLMYELLAWTRAKANLLGHDTYADMCFDTNRRMARGIHDVRALHSYFFTLLPSDSSTNENSFPDLRSYFILDRVLQQLFQLCQTLFGVTVLRQHTTDDGNVIIGWNRDVRLFHLYDEVTNEHLGSVYLDPYRRQYKAEREFTAPIVYRNKANSILPSVAISLNIDPPTWDDMPAHMTLDDVIICFHEFGHGLQHLLADVEIGGFSGCPSVEEDASEMVSQFMEYWIFDTSFLQILGQHYQTGDSIPHEIIEKVQRIRRIQQSLKLSHRLFMGELEIALFSTFDYSKESIVALQRQFAEKYLTGGSSQLQQQQQQGDITPLNQIFEETMEGKFLVQYRYLWSEVMSADAYLAFLETTTDHDNDEQKKKLLGQKFRTAFLEVSCENMDDAYLLFRGRSATPDAFVTLNDLK